MSEHRTLEMIFAFVHLLTKAPRSAPEMIELLGISKNVPTLYFKMLEAEGLIRKVGYVRPGINTRGQPMKGPLVWEWIGGRKEADTGVQEVAR